MGYYRVRKNWNNGKWDSSQICAYTDKQKAIQEWQEKHDTEVHGLKTLEDRLHAGGLIGGRYTYHFVPTSIGISGTIQCSCGEEFEFCKL